MTKFKFVVATRESEQGFFTNTATGKSLAFYNSPAIDLLLFPNNQAGLPKIYNMAIEEARDDPAVMVFAHDDLHLIDFYWQSKLLEGLETFGIIGLAGTTERASGQPSWLFQDQSLKTYDPSLLSGIVAHGHGFPPDMLSIYGIPRQEVKLLDGLLLACQSKTLIDNQLLFDEQFKFHFYDLDFCRQAEAQGVSMGTWDINLVHESLGGGYNTDAWAQAYAQYLNKWGS